MDKREQARLRKRKQRDKESVTSGSVTGQGVTESHESVTVDVTQYPAIVHALTDPDKRKKLEKIYQSLKEFKQEKNVYYGCGKDSIPFDIVGEMLEVTK